jgi:hypothetical protein
MADAWGWSKSAVDRFIQRLVDEDMVISTRAKTGTGTGTTSGTAAGQQRDIKEQRNQELPNGSIPKRARARKSPIPDEWEPKPFALGSRSREIEDGWPPGERRTQFEQFRAHHRAKGNTFTDPQAAWSTWVLNSRKFGDRNGQHPPISRLSTRQIGERLAADATGYGDRAADGVPRLSAAGGND